MGCGTHGTLQLQFEARFGVHNEKVINVRNFEEANLH